MEDVFAGSCVQSLFEPKADFSHCVNKSIKLLLKDESNFKDLNNMSIPYRNDGKVEDRNEKNGPADSGNNKGNENNRGNANSSGIDFASGHCSNREEVTVTTEKEKEKGKKYMEENLSLLNGYLYFSRIENNINLLYTELFSLKKDFLFLSKGTKKNIRKLKKIKKKNKIYKNLLNDIKMDRKRKEIYETICVQVKKLDDVQTLQLMKNKEKEKIQEYEEKIQNIENTIKMNNDNIHKTIQQIDQAVSANLG
ncbi:conserved Plasmodium protein, unknown function [Plasmodium ovale wallikeri]|uniref:Uncharacterized protein n=2 Tax=Plasmodium ovale TaxID=36330 RepID=A0A1A8Z5Q2_PLAOA|nr:conserved Plasmodium protein, unknown function [Plasmodium ovale wallikeri]SBT39113.1 conserved Plasmodium protein, unknown function [Plasmodium ovale wallikeri]SBT77756.1 conserved Plasmodium protein, unknown function [Plasmodium ovale]